jgi:hypothetical protein
MLADLEPVVDIAVRLQGLVGGGVREVGSTRVYTQPRQILLIKEQCHKIWKSIFFLKRRNK